MAAVYILLRFRQGAGILLGWDFLLSLLPGCQVGREIGPSTESIESDIVADGAICRCLVFFRAKWLAW